MATNNMAITLQDWKNRSDADGVIDPIVEILAESNPVLQDLKFIESNLPTGIRTTQRDEIPEPAIRRINQGVKPTKTNTKQIVDTITSLEARSEVDTKLLQLQPSPQAFRASEDTGIIEGFGQKVAGLIFYGNTKKSLDEFNGLDIRYKTFKGEKGSNGYQVIDSGLGAEANTTIWFVTHGERDTTGFYPKNSKLGLTVKDLGEMDAIDDVGGKFRAMTTLYSWDLGLSVRNPRSVATLRNLGIDKLMKLTAEEQADFIKKLVFTKNRLANLDTKIGNTVMYVSDTVYSVVEQILIDKNNVYVTRDEITSNHPILRFSGIPIKKIDALKEDETAIV